jgi:XapX domain-containing protein
MIQDILLSLGSGIAVGGFFAIVGAAVPAPPNLPGLLGVAGLTVGYTLVTLVRK